MAKSSVPNAASAKVRKTTERTAEAKTLIIK
jgi:hypothetical protein